MKIQTKNATYTVEPEVMTRVTAFDENGDGVWTEYTQYNIYRNGERVQFCFEEDQVIPTIQFLEEGDNIALNYFQGVTNG